MCRHIYKKNLYLLTGEMDLIKLALTTGGRLSLPPGTNMRHKCSTFDGHVSMLQLCAGIRADCRCTQGQPPTAYGKPTPWKSGSGTAGHPETSATFLPPASQSALMGFPLEQNSLRFPRAYF